MKRIFMLFAIAAVLLSACDPQKSEVVIPEPEATMHRSFIHKRNGEPLPEYMVTYLNNEITAQASIVEDGLYVHLNVPVSLGKDRLSFYITKDQLENNLMGLYTINPTSPIYMKTGHFRYTYNRADNLETSINSIIDDSMVEVNPFNHFTITGYDVKQQLISGDFEFRMLDAIDPTIDQIGATDLIKCDILLRGNFKNLKILK